MNPFTVPLDYQRRSIESATDLVSKAAVAPDRAETLADADVGQTPSSVVYSEHELDLLHYEPLTDEQHDVPIIIVYALINRPYILDLQPDRSVVRRLLEHGFDVYLIDWGEPSILDRSLGLEDYVGRYMDNCVDEVRDRSGIDAINMLGYCMGGTMAAMYTALQPDKIRNLAMMAASLCFEGDGGVLELWGSDEYYSPETVADTYGTIPAAFFDIGFALMDPVQNTVTKYAYLFDNLEDEDFVENFARMEKWLSDGIAMAGRTYQQYLEDIYQDNLFYRNEFTLNGEPVDIQNIEMPVLQIVADYDHLVPPESSVPFNDVIPSDDTTVLSTTAGHIGLSVGSRSHDELWPSVCDWFAERSTTDRDEGPSDVSLQAIDGIGEAFAERLRNAGIPDVDALADADPAALAEEIDVRESLVQDWVERATNTGES